MIAQDVAPTPTKWRNPFPSDDPRSMLLEYQYAFFSDPARFKIGLWTRQGGKDFTSEGEATAHYIGEMLKARGLKVSRLARGVPVGGELEYVDAGTIARAVMDRRSV